MTSRSPSPSGSITSTFIAHPIASNSPKPFTFPPHHSFPPFYTPQPNPLTRSSQLSSWRDLILSWCQHHRLFSLSPASTASTSLFHNRALNRKLSLDEIVNVLDWMSGDEAGRRAEWVSASKNRPSRDKAWIYWRRPEEWAAEIEKWVDGTGQKGSVLTFWEIVEGEGSKSKDFHGMEIELLHKCLQVLVKRGKAQVFGQDDQLGVKFF